MRIRPLPGGRSEPWLVGIYLDGIEIAITPADAREVALTLFEVAAATEYDGIVYRVATEQASLSVREARELIEMVGEARDKDWDS